MDAVLVEQDVFTPRRGQSLDDFIRKMVPPGDRKLLR